MATNKRKDATALFELIDKSTLKVPKRTGSLKIPSWWSSKTNPPGAAGGGSGGTGGEGTAAATGAGAGGAATAGAGSAASARTAATENKTAPAVQRRLYEPPQARAGGAGGTASPSIRPPVPVAPLSTSQAAALDSKRALHEPGAAPTEPPAAPESGAPASQTNTADAKTPQAPDEGAGAKSAAREGYAGSGTGRRVFAPQTMSQDTAPRGDWALAQKFRLARAPMWALVAGGAVLLVLLCAMIYPFSRSHAGGPRAVDADTIPAPEDDGGRRLLPRPVETAPATASQQVTPRPGPDQPREAPEPVKPVAAQWYGPGTVTRSATLYYVVIATSPSEEVSQRNAKLLAAHGVSVSYETMTSRGAAHPLYRLMSVDGFKTLSEAEPFRKKVVAIGHYVWDYAKTHKGWESAYVLRGASLPGNVAKGQ